jgi:hypothetical protein
MTPSKTTPTAPQPNIFFKGRPTYGNEPKKNRSLLHRRHSDQPLEIRKSLSVSDQDLTGRGKALPGIADSLALFD